MRQYYPIEKELKSVPKQWIINVAYTLIGDNMSLLVYKRIEERNEKLTVKKNLLIDMDPDVAAAFQNSTAVSLSKGI